MRRSKLLNGQPVAVILLLIACLVAFEPAGHTQDAVDPRRLSELRRLRDEIRLSDSLRQSDVVAIVGERAVIEATQQLAGLEILLPKGMVLRVTSVDAELKPAAAVFKIGVRAKSSVTVDLQLTGQLGTGEVVGDVFRLPFQVTKVSLGSGRVTSIFLRTLFGDWLLPKKWNEELPPLELPLEVSEVLRLPASRLDVAGSLPMEIDTPAYQTRLDFTITSFMVLDRRLVFGLRLISPQIERFDELRQIRTSSSGANDSDPVLLEREIAELSRNLEVEGGLRLRLSRRVISLLLEQIAAAEQADFKIKLKPGRIRAEAVEAVVKVLNYTDVESGDGRADVEQLQVEQISDGKVSLRLRGQGEIDARVRGREYGIPYRFSPHTNFAIKDKALLLQFAGEGDNIFLSALPGSRLPIDLRLSIKVAGRQLGINRKIEVQADRWLKRIELPNFLDREIPLPRKLEVDAGGNLYMTGKQKLNYHLFGLRFRAVEDVVDIAADVAVSAR